MRFPTFRDGLRSLADGFSSIGAGMASLNPFGNPIPPRGRDIAGLDDSRPGHVKDAEALRGDWEAVAQDFARARQNVSDAITNSTVTADDVRRLGDAYGDYVRARTKG